MLKSINEPILTDGRFWFEIVNSNVLCQLCNEMYGIVVVAVADVLVVVRRIMFESTLGW